MRHPCELQDELCDILRKIEVSFVSLQCIVQTLWQWKIIIEVTVATYICHLDFF